MFRYLPGVFLVQAVTAILLWINLDASLPEFAVRFGVPTLLITLVTGLWFASIARAEAERLNTKIRVQHAQDREQINIKAEKSKARILEKSQKEIRKQEKRIGRKASLKISLAFFAATTAGILMLVIELFTFGLMTLMTALGGMGGYLVRARQSYDANNSATTDNVGKIDVDEVFSELPPPPESLPSDIK